MDVTKLSLGKINTFIGCPLKYKLAYIDYIPADQKPTAGLSFFKALSGALEYFHKEGTTPLPSLDFLLSLLHRNWDSSGYKDAAEEKQYRELAEEILKNFHQSFASDKPDVKYLGILVSFETKRARVSSRIDRVDLLPDGTYEAIRYKTGKNVIEGPELKRDYAAAVLYQGANSHKRFRGKVSKVAYYYLRQNRKVSVTPTPQDIKVAAKLIDQTVSKINHLGKRHGFLWEKLLKRRGTAPQDLGNKGPLCSTCEYLPLCPAWPVKPRELTEETPEKYKERIRLSYSKLSSYKKCPRAWKRVYLDGVGLQPRPFFSFGTAIHEAMESLYNPAGKKKASLKYLIGLWEEAFRNNQEGYRDQVESQKYFQHGLEMIKKYFKHYVEGGKYRPAFAIEEYFEIPLGNNAVMTGYIDRIDQLDDNTYEILDYKTEPTMRSQEEVDHDDQLTIYFWAAETMFKLKIKQLALLMMDFDKKLVTTRRGEDIPQVVAEIDAIAAEMKENIRRHQTEHDAAEAECVYFPPKKNKYCRSCDFLENCSLQPDILADGKIRTMEYVDAEAQELELPEGG